MLSDPRFQRRVVSVSANEVLKILRMTNSPMATPDRKQGPLEASHMDGAKRPGLPALNFRSQKSRTYSAYRGGRGEENFALADTPQKVALVVVMPKNTTSVRDLTVALSMSCSPVPVSVRFTPGAFYISSIDSRWRSVPAVRLLSVGLRHRINTPCVARDY
jgi:hypothetical protein